MTPIKKLKTKLSSIADAIRDRTGEDDKLTLDQMADEINYMPAGDDGEAYILIDESGNEIPAFLTKEAVDLTATANDIRLGSIAVTDDGVITGEKEIPSYHTSEGMQVITAGKEFKIRNLGTRCEFTKLQALFCKSSVIVDKACINTKVYASGSDQVIAIAVADTVNQTINFGIINDTTTPYVIRYFTYKEEL